MVNWVPHSGPAVGLEWGSVAPDRLRERVILSNAKDLLSRAARELLTFHAIILRGNDLPRTVAFHPRVGPDLVAAPLKSNSDLNWAPGGGTPLFVSIRFSNIYERQSVNIRKQYRYA